MSVLVFVVFLLVANGAPLITAYLLGPYYASPVDGGKTLADGHRLFGRTKTWRGIVASVTATTLLSLLLGLSAFLGIAIAFCAMLGDLTSSYTKRRQGLSSSSFAFGIDQIPEAILPAVFVGIPVFGFGLLDVALVVILFLLLELLSSRPLQRLGIRKTVS